MKPLTFSLLRQLSDGQTHSGAALAERFGVSRPTIFSALKNLSPWGIEIEAKKGVGYRLLTPLDWLDPVLLQEAMQPLKGTLEYFPHLPSTNSFLLQKSEQHAIHRQCVVTECQTAGRGRLGRVWHASLAQGLTFSLGWHFPFSVAQLSGLTLIVGIALMRVLKPLGLTHPVGLKWPNDILAKGRKLAGVLVETHAERDAGCTAVIGIGLNVHIPPSFLDKVEQPIIGLKELGLQCTRTALLSQVLATLIPLIETFEQTGFAPFCEEWNRHHLYLNQLVELELPSSQRVWGRVLPIQADGGLHLEVAGQEQLFHSGELALKMRGLKAR